MTLLWWQWQWQSSSHLVTDSDSSQVVCHGQLYLTNFWNLEQDTILAIFKKSPIKLGLKSFEKYCPLYLHERFRSLSQTKFLDDDSLFLYGFIWGWFSTKHYFFDAWLFLNYWCKVVHDKYSRIEDKDDVEQETDNYNIDNIDDITLICMSCPSQTR